MRKHSLLLCSRSGNTLYSVQQAPKALQFSYLMKRFIFLCSRWGNTLFSVQQVPETILFSNQRKHSQLLCSRWGNTLFFVQQVPETILFSYQRKHYQLLCSRWGNEEGRVFLTYTLTDHGGRSKVTLLISLQSNFDLGYSNQWTKNRAKELEMKVCIPNWNLPTRLTWSFNSIWLSEIITITLR